MKQVLLLLVIIFSLELQAQEVNYIDARDHAVMISAETLISPPQITLRWAENDKAEGYRIKRKIAGDLFLTGDFIAELDSETLQFTDTDVQPGVAYEYEISAPSKGHVILKDNEGNNLDVEIDFVAYGYSAAGISLNEPDDYGVVLLFVDEITATALPIEINRLVDDLTSEGWTAIKHIVPRAENFDKEKVAGVKQIIQDEYVKFGNDLKTVFILGRVAVPYSGRLNPDGHGNHIGAWPADMYYAELDDSYWSDYQVSDTSASRTVNRNIPGDGKFDVSQLPGSARLDLMLGRVDLYDMPSFESSETELLRNYLNQNHDYRKNKLAIERRGLIKDAGFPAHKMVEGFAAGAWRNYGSFLGAENVSKQDFMSILKEDKYMWVYGTGGGTYTSAGGIGKTGDYADAPVYGLFSMLFGSYFGDWDSRNNFLRAPLCNEYPSLASAWSGRPQWFMHHLSAGYSLGYAAKLTQNNPGSQYYSNILYIAEYINSGVHYSIGFRYIHSALMGDPTLRLEMGLYDPPKNISGQVITNGAQFTWNDPDIEAEYHFNIYRRTAEDPVFRKINENPVTDTSFTDNSGYDGKVEYLIKTAVLHHTNTCSMYKESPGELIELYNTDISEFDQKNGISIFPNPVSDIAEIKLNSNIKGSIEAAVFDASGNKVFDFGRNYSSGPSVYKWNLIDLADETVPAGVYIFRANTSGGVYSAKIMVVR